MEDQFSKPSGGPSCEVRTASIADTINLMETFQTVRSPYGGSMIILTDGPGVTDATHALAERADQVIQDSRGRPRDEIVARVATALSTAARQDIVLRTEQALDQGIDRLPPEILPMSHVETLLDMSRSLAEPRDIANGSVARESWMRTAEAVVTRYETLTGEKF